MSPATAWAKASGSSLRATSRPCGRGGAVSVTHAAASTPGTTSSQGHVTAAWTCAPAASSTMAEASAASASRANSSAPRQATRAIARSRSSPARSQVPSSRRRTPGNVRRAVDAAAGDDRPVALCPRGNVRPAVHPRNVAQRQHVADVPAPVRRRRWRASPRRSAPSPCATRAQARRVGHEHAGDHRQRGRGREDDQIRARLRRLHTTSIEPRWCKGDPEDAGAVSR